MTGQALIGKYAFIVRGISLSDRPPNEKFRALREVTAMQAALFTRWHPVRRARALQKLPNILGSIRRKSLRHHWNPMLGRSNEVTLSVLTLTVVHV